MSLGTKPLEEAMMNADSVSSLENLSLFAMGTDGKLKKVSPNAISPYIMQLRGTYVTDLNEATEPGRYMLAGSGTILNGPDGVDLLVGMLDVYFRGGSTGTLYQEVLTRYGYHLTRARTNGSWSDWRLP